MRRQLLRSGAFVRAARRKGPHDNPSIVALDKGQPIATVQGRRAEDVSAWLQSRPPAERDRVEGVVLDMSKTYAAAIQGLFGESVQVIDRFHMVQRAVEALDEVLRSLHKQLAPEDAKALKQRRRRWLQSAVLHCGVSPSPNAACKHQKHTVC